MYVDPYLQKIHRIKDHEDRSGFLRLDMNENPTGLPEEFVQEVLSGITAETIASYPRKDALINLIAEREGVEAENITLTNGSDEGIKLLYETFTKEGSNVVMVSPTFEMYHIYAEMFGVEVKAILYGEDFVITAQQIVDTMDENTDMVVLLNPNSPIGGVYSDEEFCQIIEKAVLCNAVVCIDEAYYPFGVSTKVELTKKYENVLILRTFSKLFSMAGVRIGYIIGNKLPIYYIENAEGSYNVNTIGILFAEAILKRPEIIRQLVDTEKEGKAYLVEQLEKSSYKYYGQHGNYILIKTKKMPREVATELRVYNILIKTYGNALLQDWIRVTTADVKTMKTFWDAFAKVEEL